ncbi:MAG: pyruvate/2-oxoglutarate dehydrogenase complex dihydrolipoamide dehydrogenase (E3) component [Candidatus Poriferisodalaceae bacterium]|jgi:pyruvate/2-oxoglutarate dehydrogenase complex dihydrolipoamide dehydrogenase (E3) component
MSVKKTADLVVVGGGAAGLAAAFQARFRGASVVIVQQGPVGGECTFSGCVPSKALLAAAARGASFGEAMSSVHAAIAQIAAAEDSAALKPRGIEVISGRGEVDEQGRVSVNGTRLSSKAVILAFGSAPMVPPIPGLRETPHLTNESLFQLVELPARLAIIGGGPIGCEMAQAFSQLGSQVTVLEGVDRLLPRDDVDASEVVRAALEARGVVVRTGEFVANVSQKPDGIVLSVGESRVTVDRVLVAVGRKPAFKSVGGLELSERGWINVDEQLKTNLDGVYAIGDAIGSVQLTHAAGAMAGVAVDNALNAGLARFKKRVWEPESIGWTTFTSPEVAQIGMTEQQAASVSGAQVAEVAMSEVDRAIAVGHQEGFIKLIAAPRRIIGMAGGGRLIGATVVAERAGEMAGELALAHATGMFVGRLAQVVHPYPTWSMAITQAATQFFTDSYSGRRTREPIG